MKRTTKIPHTLAVASLLLASTAACGQSDSPATASRSGDDSSSSVVQSPKDTDGDAFKDVVDVGVLRGSRDGRLFAESSPEQLADKMSTVVEGTIAGWADGPTIENYDERDYSAVLKIKVSRSFKSGQSTIDRDGHVYAYFPRGGEVIDANGDAVVNPGAASTVTSLDDLAKAAPIGTDVLLLAADPMPLDEGISDEQVKVGNADAGLQAGTPLLRPHAQGLLLDNNGALASAGADGEPWDWFSSGTDNAAKSPASTGQFAAVVDRLNKQFPDSRKLN